MVFFTCNKCGESLKKKDVEKHCNTRCRGAPFLTCVDCLKDFREDFVKHTVCVSEDDRYSANGLKGLQGKQKSKQQLWVETVQYTVSRTIDDGVPGVTPSIRSLLLWLQDQPTLPDKGKAFTNFVKNARRSEPLQNIDFVWKILEQSRIELQAKLKAEREAAEAERRKLKEQKQQQKPESSDSSSDDSSDDEDPKKNGTNKTSQSNNIEIQENKISKTEKKKKRMVSESESVVNGSSEFRKNKKSKKNPEDESHLTNTSNLDNAMNACHLNGDGNVEGKKLSKKERKELKKKAKFEAELKEIETAETCSNDEQPVEEQPTVTEGPKGKKNKNKKESGTTADGTTEGKDRKKTKKKKGNEENIDVESIGEGISAKKNEKEKIETGKLNETLHMEEEERAKFSWDAAILQVLESQSDKEISLKKLSKKIINEYLYFLGGGGPKDEAKASTKLHKKLEKMHNVIVHKDKVKLKTSRD